MHDSPVGTAVFSPDGARVATTPDDTTVRIWDTRTGIETARLVHDDGIATAVFSPDGANVVSASRDKTARIWDAVRGTELARFTHDASVNDATFSLDGARVVTASDDKTARVWDAADGAEIVRLTHDGDYEVKNAAFSPDGARVVTASGRAARVWDVASGVETSRLLHEGSVRSITFNPDGARILTSSYDKTARIWDTVSGIELARFTHDAFVYNATFSPDGTRVMTVWEGGATRLWDVTWAAKLTGDHLVRAVARARLIGDGRLTDEESRVLRPIVGEINPDVVSRWLAPCPEDAQIEAMLAPWHRHREMALGLAKKEWAARAEKIHADRRSNTRGATPSHSAPAVVGALLASAPRSGTPTLRQYPFLTWPWIMFVLLAATAVFALAATRSAVLWP